MSDTEPETAEVKHKNSDFVHMRHPDIGGPAAGPVTYEAFKVVHEPKGWYLADEAEVVEEENAKALGQQAALAIQPDQVDMLDQQALENLAIEWKIDPTEFYEFEGSTATGEVDLDGLRDAIKTKIEEGGTQPQS